MNMLNRMLALPLSLLALLGNAACADETEIRAEIAKKFPNASIESVTKTPQLGLYEVVVDGQIFYTDANFKYLIDGAIIETADMSNLTARRQQELEEAKLKKL